MLRRVVWVGVVVAVAGSGVAVADAPRKGARYTGRTSQHRKVSARVTSDGRTFQFRFDQVFRCSNGHMKISEAKYLHQAPTIRADGTFSYHKTYKNEPGVPGFDQRHTDEQTVTGSFADGGRRVRATVKDVTTGRTLTCRSTVSFTATAKE